LYDIRPGNGAGQFLQPRSPHWADEPKCNMELFFWSTGAMAGCRSWCFLPVCQKDSKPGSLGEISAPKHRVTTVPCE